MVKTNKNKKKCKHEWVQMIDGSHTGIIMPTWFCKWCLEFKYFFKSIAVDEEGLRP